ncbi:signaling lymphocytic activation molecule isoform X1 [Oenanthe melanoleuca]|uniref:signaling lymphocytic activation molecule isoform X1 n=1 Tax=Oenanthe melanoleuca TaxID=2939378 RepID=UPI0024C1DE4D|nr:signaling lymphocytic activation molecule isoform X1 [Oenanthe melanoleuca]
MTRGSTSTASARGQRRSSGRSSCRCSVKKSSGNSHDGRSRLFLGCSWLFPECSWVFLECSLLFPECSWVFPWMFVAFSWKFLSFSWMFLAFSWIFLAFSGMTLEFSWMFLAFSWKLLAFSWMFLAFFLDVPGFLLDGSGILGQSLGEPVADPNIQILHRELSNGSCSLSLLCTSERGDEVSYSWDSWDNRTRGICSGNGRVLNVSYSLWNDSIRCVCTARNRVSSRDVAFDSSQCGSEQRGVPGVRTELLVPLVALGVIVIIIVAIVTVRATHSAKCCQVPSQVTPIGATSATIYAQVQKPKGTVPNAAPVSCTTIYAAATGPPLATDGAPRSPAASPTPRGHPQDTTTVYASVTLPVA